MTAGPMMASYSGQEPAQSGPSVAGLLARPLRKAWLLSGGVKVRNVSRASWLTRLGTLAPSSADLTLGFSGGQGLDELPGFFGMLGVGIDHISAPEEPVAGMPAGPSGRSTTSQLKSAWRGYRGSPSGRSGTSRPDRPGRAARCLRHRAPPHQNRCRAALKGKTGQRFRAVQAAGGAVFVEETAAGRIEPGAVGAPPGICTVTVDVGAESADLPGPPRGRNPNPTHLLAASSRGSAPRLR